MGINLGSPKYKEKIGKDWSINFFQNLWDFRACSEMFSIHPNFYEYILSKEKLRIQVKINSPQFFLFFMFSWNSLKESKKCVIYWWEKGHQFHFLTGSACMSWNVPALWRFFFFLDNRKIKSQPQTRINKKERQFHRQRSHPVSKKRPRNRFFYHPTDELNWKKLTAIYEYVNQSGKRSI